MGVTCDLCSGEGVCSHRGNLNLGLEYGQLEKIRPRRLFHHCTRFSSAGNLRQRPGEYNKINQLFHSSLQLYYMALSSWSNNRKRKDSVWSSLVTGKIEL